MQQHGQLHGLSTVHSPLAVVAWHKRCLITIEPAGSTARARPRPSPVSACIPVPPQLWSLCDSCGTTRRCVAVAAHKFEYNTKNNINIARQQRQQQGDKINECKRKQRVTHTHTYTEHSRLTHGRTHSVCCPRQTAKRGEEKLQKMKFK